MTPGEAVIDAGKQLDMLNAGAASQGDHAALQCKATAALQVQLFAETIHVEHATLKHMYACSQRPLEASRSRLSKFESIAKHMHITVLGELQVLLGQLDCFPALPDAVPALHRLCNEPEVRVCVQAGYFDAFHTSMTHQAWLQAWLQQSDASAQRVVLAFGVVAHAVSNRVVVVSVQSQYQVRHLATHARRSGSGSCG